MGKKKLDKLFQEKLQDFSEIPDHKVWASIETSLDEKKKSRKVIPIWWKLGGAAAVLTFALFMLNPFEKDTSQSPAVTKTKNASEKVGEENQQIETLKNEFEKPSTKASQVVVSDQENNSSKKQRISSGPIDNSAIEKIKSDSNKKNTDIRFSKKSQLNNSKLAENQLEKSANEKEGLDKSINKKQVDVLPTNKEAIAAVEKENTQNSAAKKDRQNYNDIENGVIGESKKEELAQITEEANKKSIYDEIAAQEKEEDLVADNSKSKWSAGPSIAPVYFNALGEGSPVHSIFVANSKSGNVNMSYGLSVAYEISKKLSIRSGVHKVDYGYNTNDIAFSSSVEATTSNEISNVDFALTAKNLVVGSRSNTAVETSNQNLSLDTQSSEVSATSATRNGVMEQQFGYVEVPVELNYALVDKRFGINLIGGLSSLFLVDNSVSLTSGELTTEMGEANNVNAVNFSTNVGFGVNYKFTPKVMINIEPVFKYQLNTFSATEGSFQPFSVGVYSGLSFRF